jgi:hypothetical protein
MGSGGEAPIKETVSENDAEPAVDDVVKAIAEAEHARDATGDERKLAALGLLGRRGRPRSVSQELLAKVEKMMDLPEVGSRTRVNNHYAAQGATALGLLDSSKRDDPVVSALRVFFYGPPGTRKRSRNEKRGALVEVGRIADKFGAETAKELARQIYEKYRVSNSRPRTGDIARDLRTWRMEVEGRKRSSAEDGLYRKLSRLIAEHRKLYPDMAAYEVSGVVSRVQDDLIAEMD